jgi:LuxR family transcriptional regulator, maltose regulon positive regulatory protein
VATKKIAGDIPIPELLDGVTLSRTLPPRLPANFISRSHLVDSINTDAPGTTLIVGPLGYGKSSLAAEIARHNEGRTFWYTMVDEDNAPKFNSHVIQAVRNVIPGFAPWFKSDLRIDSMDLIAKFSAELEALKGEYIFIVDNRRTKSAEDFARANEMIKSLPKNLHLIQVRNDQPHASPIELAPVGKLNSVGPAELKFTSDEMMTMILLSGLTDKSKQILEILESAQGWPAAVQLIIRGAAKGVSFKISAAQIASSVDPLRLVVAEFVRSLPLEEKAILLPLSIVEEFTPELAQAILGKSYSQSALDTFASEGTVLVKRSDLTPIYKIHSLIRESLYQEVSSAEASCADYHRLASLFYEGELEPTKALEHAFLSKDFVRFEKLFRAGARIYAITGSGNDLLRWAKYAGDESVQGQLQRQTVEIGGHLANLSFEKAEALKASMRLQSRGTALEGFIDRFAALIDVAINFSIGQFKDFEATAETAFTDDAFAGDVDFTDALFVLRRLAGYYFMLDDVDKLEEIDQRAKELLARNFSQLGHVHQLAVRALCAYQQSYYQDAFESSRMALSLSNTLGMASFQAPLDIKYILARCHYEFTDLDSSYEIFNEVSESAAKNQQWVWYCATAAFVSVTLAQRGDGQGSVQMLRDARERVSLIHSKNQLHSILDRSELVMQLISGDLEKMKLLIETALPGRTTELISLHILRAEGKEWNPSNGADLPERTPRQRIYKFLSQTVHAYEADEELAITYLTQALKIGAEVGAKAVFIRQMELYPLFHKVAVRSPTFYNEEISRKVAERMQEIDSTKGVQPMLTKREIEIVRHLDSGKPITSIGASLHISHNTMKTHLKNVYRKLGADGRDQAVEKAKSLGLI